jgi:hypothetical protein
MLLIRGKRLGPFLADRGAPRLCGARLATAIFAILKNEVEENHQVRPGNPAIDVPMFLGFMKFHSQ